MNTQPSLFRTKLAATLTAVLGCSGPIPENLPMDSGVDRYVPPRMDVTSTQRDAIQDRGVTTDTGRDVSIQDRPPSMTPYTSGTPLDAYNAIFPGSTFLIANNASDCIAFTMRPPALAENIPSDGVLHFSTTGVAVVLSGYDPTYRPPAGGITNLSLHGVYQPANTVNIDAQLSLLAVSGTLTSAILAFDITPTTTRSTSQGLFTPIHATLTSSTISCPMNIDNIRVAYNGMDYFTPRNLQVSFGSISFGRSGVVTQMGSGTMMSGGSAVTGGWRMQLVNRGN